MNVGRTTPSDFDPCFHTGSEAGAAAEVIDSDIEALNNVGQFGSPRAWLCSERLAFDRAHHLSSRTHPHKQETMAKMSVLAGSGTSDAGHELAGVGAWSFSVQRDCTLTEYAWGPCSYAGHQLAGVGAWSFCPNGSHVDASMLGVRPASKTA